MNYMINYDLTKMSIKDKIGQLTMFGFDGLEVNDDVIKLIKEYRCGNIILFARNIKSPEQLFNLNKNLQKLALKELGFPLFISIDQEGGMVTRIFNGSTYFPGAMTTSATNNPNNAYKLGKMMGKELHTLGVNMNLAPVMDVNNNPHNPVIGVRSYSDKPEVVADYSWEFSRGMQEENVFATAKHFPGHGDTNVDSHLGLPVINHSLEELEKLEFIPFKNAINKGIKAIMSSHINFPKLTNDERPATLCSEIMTDLVRKDMGFEGLIVSDGMGMKGVVDRYSTEEACFLAIKAGINLVCVCHPYEPRYETYETLYEAVKTNRLTLEELDERVKRVLEAKKELVLNDLNLNFEDVKHLVVNNEHSNFAYQVVEDAVTLVKGNPIKLNKKALFIGMLPMALTIADDTDGDSRLIKGFKELENLDVNIIDVNPTNEQILEMVNKSKNYEQVIFTTYNGNTNKNQIRLIDELAKIDNDLHVISLRNPYDLFYTKNIKNYVCLYEYTPNSVKALVRYLKGEIVPKGIIPVIYE